MANFLLFSTLYLSFVIVTVSAFTTSLQEGQQCKTPDQARGKCIRLKKCKSLLEMIQKVPLFEEDANFLRDSQCGYDNEPLVCCTDYMTNVPDSHTIELEPEEPIIPADDGFVVTEQPTTRDWHTIELEPDITEEPIIPADDGFVVTEQPTTRDWHTIELEPDVTEKPITPADDGLVVVEEVIIPVVDGFVVIEEFMKPDSQAIELEPDVAEQPIIPDSQTIELGPDFVDQPIIPDSQTIELGPDVAEQPIIPDSQTIEPEPDIIEEPIIPVDYGFTQLSNLLPTADVCELQNDRIFGGTISMIDEFPWMALLEYNKPRNRKGFHCGGVLINERYILTAAHCMAAPEMKKMKWVLSSVRLGEYDLSKNPDCYFEDRCIPPPVDIAVEKLIPHEKYAPTSKAQEHDIALIRLSRPVTYTDYIKPICLPGGDRMKSLSLNGLDMVVAGWGKTENASSSNVKLKLTIAGVPNSECSSAYQTHYRRHIFDTQLCAGGVRGQDSCNGDSGGPLMYTDHVSVGKAYWYCVGIVSFGPTPCGREGFPGVYTRISSYTDWIVKNIEP